MATTTISQNLTRGGGFLIADSRPEDVFTPADLNDDQRLIGQTAKEFVDKEVLPQVADLEHHKEGLLPELLKKAGEIGLLGGGIAEAYGGSELDKVSATVLAEKLAGYASFAVSHGGHAGIGTVPIVYLARQSKRKNICRKSPPANCSPATAFPNLKPGPMRWPRAPAPCFPPTASTGF